MKIKCQPNDFKVEEIINLNLTKTGEYSIYKLDKRSWDTFDLLDFLSRKYKIKNVGRAGIKDRYSHSIQYISVKDSKVQDIKEQNFNLQYIGKSQCPITQNNLEKNQFTIVIRDLAKQEAETIIKKTDTVKIFGFPNYYDEQRMGSARANQGFIAQKLMFEHYNGALKFYLAIASKYDDSKTRKLKKFINDNWGDWDKCLAELKELGQYQYPLVYLVKHPKDFKGAIKTIRRDLLEMFISAYQAYIWNETIKRTFVNQGIKIYSKTYNFGQLYFYNELNQTEFFYFKTLLIPAVSYKTVFNDENVNLALEQVLKEESDKIGQDLTIKSFKLKLDIKGLFFKPYERKAIIIPENINISGPADDELYPSRQKLALSFALPKGSYATILLKRVASD